MTDENIGYNDALSGKVPRKLEDWIILFGFQLHDAARLRKIFLDEIFKPLNITRSQAWALAYLSRTDGLTQSELADIMKIGKVTLGGLLDRLEERSLIERKSSPTDRRINIVFLTKDGRKAARDMRELVLKNNKTILKGVDNKDLKTATNVLTQIINNLAEFQ